MARSGGLELGKGMYLRYLELVLMLLVLMLGLGVRVTVSGQI